MPRARGVRRGTGCPGLSPRAASLHLCMPAAPGTPSPVHLYADLPPEAWERGPKPLVMWPGLLATRGLSKSHPIHRARHLSFSYHLRDCKNFRSLVPEMGPKIKYVFLVRNHNIPHTSCEELTRCFLPGKGLVRHPSNTPACIRTHPCTPFLSQASLTKETL